MTKTTAIVVLGMHRSGTSALTGSLGILGVELGQDMRVPHAGVNAKGYWEHLGVLDAHERILRLLGSSWDDVRPLPDTWWERPDLEPHLQRMTAILRHDFSNASIWGVKDPRTCRLVPIWLEVFRRLECRFGFVLTTRDPREVARSLAKRDAFNIDKSVLLWVENNLAAEKATRGQPRVFLGFDDLLQDPPSALARIEQHLGVRFPKRLEDAAPALREFLTPQLRNHVADAGSMRSELGKNADFAERVDRVLNASRFGENDETSRMWESVQSEYAELVASYEPAVERHVADLQERIGDLTKRIQRLESSASWQVTKPLRKIERFVTRVFERSDEVL